MTIVWNTRTILWLLHLYFFLYNTSISHPSVCQRWHWCRITTVIRSVTSNLLCPIRIFDASRRGERQEQSRPSRFWGPRFGGSMRPLDRKARPYGTIATDSAKPLARISGLIKHKGRSVGRELNGLWSLLVVIVIDPRSVSFVMSLRYDPSGFRMLSCRFRASVMRFDGSIHPAGEEIPASKLTKLRANFPAKIFHRLITGFSVVFCNGKPGSIPASREFSSESWFGI